MATLNERAAKAMGWVKNTDPAYGKWWATNPNELRTFIMPINNYDPEHNLQQAMELMNQINTWSIIKAIEAYTARAGQSEAKAMSWKDLPRAITQAVVEAMEQS